MIAEKRCDVWIQCHWNGLCKCWKV